MMKKTKARLRESTQTTVTNTRYLHKAAITKANITGCVTDAKSISW